MNEALLLPTVAITAASIVIIGVLILVGILAQRTAELKGMVSVLFKALSVEVEEEYRQVGPMRIGTDYRLKGRLSDEDLRRFGLEATPSQRLRPQHPYAMRPESRTPLPYGDSWPPHQPPQQGYGPHSAPLGYGVAAPHSGYGQPAPHSNNGRVSYGPNSRGR